MTTELLQCVEPRPLSLGRRCPGRRQLGLRLQKVGFGKHTAVAPLAERIERSLRRLLGSPG